MKLSLRGPSVALEVRPAELVPTQEFDAVVELEDEIDGVASATLELGYVNTYSYHWAGRSGAAMAHDDASIVNIGTVGTSYGSVKDANDWVSVQTQELPLVGGKLESGGRSIRLRVPSWAPGSSKELVRWQVRLSVDRAKGRDADAEADFTVRTPQPPQPPAELALERLMGDASDIDILLERPCWRAGETIRGEVVITPKAELPEADVAVFLQRRRRSHPLERNPAPDYEYEGADRVTIDKHLTLHSGAATRLGFEIPLPADAGPTAEAVHGSLDWFVQVRILYKGFNSPMPERVRREFIVFNAG